GGAAARVLLQVGDERDHALRRDRLEERLDVVEQVEEAERLDDGQPLAGSAAPASWVSARRAPAAAQSRSTRRKRPAWAFVSPSRPRRKISRAVAPTPPASRKPMPSAPIVASGRFARSFARTSVATLKLSRSDSAAPASSSRSDSISRRTSATVR